MHIIYFKMFHICKDFLSLIRNFQVTTSYSLRGLTVMSAFFPNSSHESD